MAGMHNHFCRRNYFSLSILVALGCLWTLATLHGQMAYGSISIYSYIIPTIVALIVGSLIAYLVTLRLKLHDTSEQFRAIADLAQEFIYLRQVDGVYQYVSPSCYDVTGYTHNDFYTHPNLMDELIYKEDLPKWRDHIHEVNEGNRAQSLDIRLYNKQGNLVWINHICMPVYDEQGIQTGVRSTNLNITERKENENRLRQVSIIFDNTTEGIFITDTEANILVANQALLEISGFPEEEVIGQTPRLWKSDHHDEFFYQEMWSAITKTGKWRGEIWNRRKNGNIYPAWITVNPVYDEQGNLTNYVSILADISSVKKSQEQIEFLAHHDSLTKLPNRLLFNARLEQSLQHAQREKSCVAVLFLDLDNFKSINDGLGHPVGDRLLLKVARRLSSQVRQCDTVARIAGDEFAIILGSIKSNQDISMFAKKLLSAFDAPFDIEERDLHISSSIGISLYPDDGKDVTTLVQHADAAMYRAKEHGRNRYCFYTSELTQAALERLQIENELRKALKRDQLSVFYQPQYSMTTGELIGAEALLRWQHPDLGEVSPAHFIPIAESAGLIIPIGEWVLRRACTHLKKWRDAGLNMNYVAVNVAGQQIQHTDMVHTAKKILDETGLPSECLELEITESFIMQRTKHAIMSLEELKKLGLTLAIDDFGTGYSSLIYLKSLPINRLKLDRSFVKNTPQDSDDVAIARAVIALGKSLELEVVAEGIENEEQRAFLISEGCHIGQGFLYSRAISAADFEIILKEEYLGDN